MSSASLMMEPCIFTRVIRYQTELHTEPRRGRLELATAALVCSTTCWTRNRSAASLCMRLELRVSVFLCDCVNVRFLGVRACVHPCDMFVCTRVAPDLIAGISLSYLVNLFNLVLERRDYAPMADGGVLIKRRKRTCFKITSYHSNDDDC